MTRKNRFFSGFASVLRRAWSGLCPWLASLCLLSAGVSDSFALAPPVTEGEAPRVQALLEQAWASEVGRGLNQNRWLAAVLYRQAGQMGSAEGYYRAALAAMPGNGAHPGRRVAVCLLAAASQLGHLKAEAYLQRLGRTGLVVDVNACDDEFGVPGVLVRFDMERYILGLPQPKRQVVALIRKLAPRYGVDPRLALAVASVESNFNSLALSPKAAMGVMQLIPATAERFNVLNPFNAEQNIRGGLAYLRWLHRYFRGDVVRVIAAYNAGEGAVTTHNGVPPYNETQAYVVRVLSYSGIGFNDLPPTAAGPMLSQR